MVSPLYAATGETRPGTAMTCHWVPFDVAALNTLTVSPVALRVAVTVTISAWRCTVALGNFSMVDNKASSWAVVSAVGSDFMMTPITGYGLRCGTIATVKL